MWVLALASVLILAAVGAVLVGSAVVLRHRAAAAADLAALAGAVRAVEGAASACAAAADIAAANGADLVECRLVGLEVTVDVVVRADLGLVGAVSAAGRARAGPVTGPPVAPTD